MTQKINFLVVRGFAFLLFNSFAWAEAYSPSANTDTKAEEIRELSDLSLEELMNIPVEVGTKRPTTVKETPGIITVITEKELRTSGAKDLTDILLQVPGFTLALDVQGVVGIAFRGIWGHEGKILLLWDGHELNEALYGTIQLGRHYPVDSIHKIEIIRGPGSVIQGGFSELAVINVITKNADELNGIHASVNYGQMENALGGRNINLSFGKKWDDLSITLQTFFSEGQRSNKNYTDSTGDTYNFNKNSTLNSSLINFNLNYKDFDFKLFTNFYHTLQRDSYGINFSTPVQTDFAHTSILFQYRWQASQELNLRPYFKYSTQSPWKATYPDQIQEQNDARYDKTANRLTTGVELNWNISKTISLLTGIEANQYSALTKIPSTFTNGSTELSFSDGVAFGQMIYSNPIANLTLGARYISNSIYGSNWVPRIGLTKSLDDWNFKLLYSHAYRPPVFENFNQNPSIRPETTKVIEFEIVKTLDSFNNISLNLFKTLISDPIVYGTINASDAYYNFPNTGSIGFELQHRIQGKGGYLISSYSYSASSDNEVENYKASNSTVMMGMSKHKISLLGNKEILWSDLSFSPSLVWLSSREGYSWSSSDGFALRDLGSVLLINLYFIQNNFLLKNFSFALGVANLLNSENTYIQAYNQKNDTGHPPIPGPGREYLTRLTYSIPL